jgi:hypothetical protein
MEELGDQRRVVFAYFVTGITMEELGNQCKVVFAYFFTGNTMEELEDQCKVVFAYFVTGNTTVHIQTPQKSQWNFTPKNGPEKTMSRSYISTCCNCPSYNPPLPDLFIE